MFTKRWVKQFPEQLGQTISGIPGSDDYRNGGSKTSGIFTCSKPRLNLIVITCPADGLALCSAVVFYCVNSSLRSCKADKSACGYPSNLRAGAEYRFSKNHSEHGFEQFLSSCLQVLNHAFLSSCSTKLICGTIKHRKSFGPILRSLLSGFSPAPLIGLALKLFF
jgi:hypothetical protein